MFIFLYHFIRTDDSSSAAAEGPSSGTGRKRKAPARKTTAKRTKKDMEAGVVNNLDMTCIHPESYPMADRSVWHLVGFVEPR